VVHVSQHSWLDKWCGQWMHCLHGVTCNLLQLQNKYRIARGKTKGRTHGWMNGWMDIWKVGMAVGGNNSMTLKLRSVNFVHVYIYCMYVCMYVYMYVCMYVRNIPMKQLQ
jgi:hypothetical protein